MPNLVRRLSRRNSNNSSSSCSDDDERGRQPAAAVGGSPASSRSSSRSRSHSRNSHAAAGSSKDGELPAPILVYHTSARSIVFRDHLRRAQQEASSEGHHSRSGSFDSVASSCSTVVTMSDRSSHPSPPSPGGGAVVDKIGTMLAVADDLLDTETTVVPSEAGISETQIAGFQPRIVPLARLDLGPNDSFEAFLQSSCEENSSWTSAEREVVQLLRNQRACVKTVQNKEWTVFLSRFQFPQQQHPGTNIRMSIRDDLPPTKEYPFNSFVTSTSLLPPNGLKMRTFGSTNQYTVGAVFALPEFESDEQEQEAAQATHTWAWPSGFSAKTEFNIDSHGNLINGRAEALVSFATLRQYNEDYLHKDEYMVAMRQVSGLSQVPYNEVFLRVGGVGRLVNGVDVATEQVAKRSLNHGVGLPIALFTRTATFGDLITLLRTRSRLIHTLGEHHMRGIPLLLISPTIGVRVLTESLQKELWKIAACDLNPFQNPAIAHRTSIVKTDEESFQIKVDELLDLDENVREILTPEELGHLAGGFGATDESVAAILKDALLYDQKMNQQQSPQEQQQSHRLQDVVNEGLAHAVRSGDYHTSRQLLILYTLVASKSTSVTDAYSLDGEEDGLSDWSDRENDDHKIDQARPAKLKNRSSSLGRDVDMVVALTRHESELTRSSSSLPVPPPPPPPPLDTDRLRSATNSDGLLAVLGAAQVLKAMRDESAKRRVHEAISAVEEWINYGEQSMAFRLSSWFDQRAAQGDLKIATNDRSNMMAFVSNKAINNRKTFVGKLKDAASVTDFNDVRFLKALLEMLSQMHSPCLRLELLQYVLGLDNRYSVAHVARSVELAATCLGMVR